MNLQGTKFELEFFSLPLIGLDMVLGVQWLESLGSVVCDWKKSTMEFMWQQKSRKLQGLVSTPIQTTFVNGLLKEFHQRKSIFAVINMLVQDQGVINKEMQAILD